MVWGSASLAGVPDLSCEEEGTGKSIKTSRADVLGIQTYIFTFHLQLGLVESET